MSLADWGTAVQESDWVIDACASRDAVVIAEYFERPCFRAHRDLHAGPTSGGARRRRVI
jgi:hypothetical protein